MAPDHRTAHVDPSHREAAAPYFDAAYYIASNPCIQASGVDPLDHFLQQGWREGRNPSHGFDVAHYLSAHLDVAAVGLNPLVHYAWAGRQEGRSVRRPLDAERRQLEGSRPPRSRLREWEAAADRSAPLDLVALQAALLGRVGRGIVVSLSHDDYPAHCGGIQSLLADEQAAFAVSGWSYLHLSPAAPLPMLADAAEADGFRFRVRLDGTALGLATSCDVLALLAARRVAGTGLEVVVHHLMGHVPELVAALCAAAAVRPWLWVHDFFTLCPSYALMRNDVRFCAAPPLGSAACTVCSFGADRLEHAPRMQAFFESARPNILAPSAAALEHWLRLSRLPHGSADAVPLAHLAMGAARCRGTGAGTRLRVAHLGARVTHKGWFVFQELALRLAGDPRYEFLHLGGENGPALPGCIRHVPVRVGPGRRDAMVEAVAERRIDVVVGWSLWPETFCFVAHEAMAGGAFVVARAGAGNVWPAVEAQAPDGGCRLESEAELAALFATGDILRRVAEAPLAYGALIRGGGSADRILQAARPRPEPARTGLLGLGLPGDAVERRAVAEHA